jgi:pimeloyl-ACP methyl ester carboxylesterase
MNWHRVCFFSASARRIGRVALVLLAAAAPLASQSFRDLKMPDKPLVLAAQGSFFVGGQKSRQTRVELGNLGPEGNITVHQMYVRFMIPKGGEKNVPVVMVHGATLTGKSWETTPDGRMGWDEYFVRKGHPVYVPDQVGRGRSGFNQAPFNDVRAGLAPPNSQPNFLRFSDEIIWPNFRFGERPGEPYAETQYPVHAVDELSKQGVPDLTYSGLPVPTPTIRALADLAGDLDGAVLMGHSQSGPFPLEAALLNPAAARGLVLIELGRCPSTYTDAQIATLARIPILALYGDYLDTPTGISRLPSWKISFDSCMELIRRINAAGGRAQMLYPPERGVRGNSHMIMQDRNHLQIADWILAWIRQEVTGLHRRR